MRTLVAVAALILALSSHAADSVDTALNRILTKEQYELLKVDSLSADQKGALLEALKNAYAAGQAEVTVDREPPRVVTPPAAPTSNVVESQIDGAFEGWEGDTIVKLMNGQIWPQTEYHYHYHYAFMPDVLIYQATGGYKMKVEGVDKAVGVKRLK